MLNAVAAKRNSDRGKVVRKTVLGPFPAMVKVGLKAEMRFFDNGGERTYYQFFVMPIRGGVVEISVFGQAEPGKTIPAHVEVKTKTEMGQETHYVRAEVFTPDQRLRHKLHIGIIDDPNVKLDPEAPSLIIHERGRRFRIGFTRR